MCITPMSINIENDHWWPANQITNVNDPISDQAMSMKVTYWNNINNRQAILMTNQSEANAWLTRNDEAVIQ